MQYIREKVTADHETPVIVPPPIMWPPVTPDLSITPRDQARWQRFVNTHYDCRPDITEWIGTHSNLRQMTQDQTATRTATSAGTYNSRVWETDQRGAVFTNSNNQLHISQISKIQMLRSMWCWRIKQMQGEKTGARVIQKKIYIPRDTEDRATNRQRWPVFCIHRAHSCRFLLRNIDRQCWKQTRTWIV